ncbi:MAG: hypothetical protein CVV64_06935 [Candidatus Wallbacteria bacterium HGW-Wallbacteria-1]|jgi:hypothetical protein|uniref:DNA polymerase III subunit delta n=1 Tax=Candidatus Wallbacteria bacterium HGW-Wallbacteria-1 TaxID=2013854 RepID=A0A2N1PT19_9BACT|nr:MAG: hypothetical protein CVV64_06935 [Candidatus Wallbacteria bacterium HGW-Wallbacteria-1]
MAASDFSSVVAIDSISCLLPGLEDISLTLLSSVRGHAYLLHGRDSAVVEMSAEAVTASLLCASPIQGRPCRNCDSCRRIETGSHPNLIHVSPSGREILKEEVEELRMAVYVGRDTERRICRIDSCHFMNSSSGNAILKVLEEPPPGVMFILSTHRPDAVLETIRSRCLPIFIKSPAISEMKSFLENCGQGDFNPDSLAWALSFKPGVLVAAIRCSKGDFIPLLESLHSMIEELKILFEIIDPWDMAASLERAAAVFTTVIVDMIEGICSRDQGVVERCRAFHSLAMAVLFREASFVLADCLDNSSRGEGVILSQALLGFLETLARDRAPMDCADEGDDIRYDSDAEVFRQWTSDGAVEIVPADLKRSFVSLIREFLSTLAEVYKTYARTAVSDLNFLMGCDKINHLKAGVSRNGMHHSEQRASLLDEAALHIGTSTNLALCLETLFSRLEKIRHG